MISSARRLVRLSSPKLPVKDNEGVGDFSFTRVVNPKPGWYRGDFHVHTQASDGDYPASLVVDIARAEGLDFIAITDHNSIEAFSELSQSTDFLVIPGIEVTFEGGHFNVFGITGWHDWMEDICGDKITVPLPGRYRTISELIGEIAAEGLLNSIDHPRLHPWEWRYLSTDLRLVHCVELLGDLYWPDNVHANPKAVALWTAWLNAGYRITAIGGSDYHYPPRPEEGKPGERLGMFSTYVYAEELSVAGIIDGLRRRRAYVSRGLRVTFEAGANDTTYEIGADLGERKGEIELTAIVLDKLSGSRAQIIKNGDVIAETRVRGDRASLQSRDNVNPARSDWYRFEVWDQSGQALAITNPIFVGPRRTPERHLYGDFINIPTHRRKP